ncbi:MAG: Mov34/MPN/PAD-1 family protein [Gammaproteobacteria bacterium]
MGIWHSHLDHPACPSETDRIVAWEDYSNVIASARRAGITDLRSFRLLSNAFVEEEITHDPCNDSHSDTVAKLYRGR